MLEYLSSAEEVLRRMGVDPRAGLTSAQARESAATKGRNELTRAKPESLLRRVWHAATEPMILILFAALAISVAVNVFRAATGEAPDVFECVGIFAAIVLSAAITLVMEGRSAKAFEALSKINDDTAVKAVRDGGPVALHKRDVVVGDIVTLETGDKIPADGRLVESNGLCVDESALTGESAPVEKDAEKVLTDAKAGVHERCNMLYAGTYATAGFGRMVVTAVGDATEFGNIAAGLSGAQRAATPLQERLGRLGKMITLCGVGAAAVVFAAQLAVFWQSGALALPAVMEAFVTSIVLIVAAVPEGLPTIVAVSLSINMIKLSRENALVKKIIATETVGCVTVICSDKTGTLTENKMTVLGSITDENILRNICVNSTADLAADGAFIGNATECALLKAAAKSGWDYRECRKKNEVVETLPFSSENKFMATLAQTPDGLAAFAKGSPEAIFALCGMDEKARAEIEKQIAPLQQQACRVIAFAHLDCGSEEKFWSAEARNELPLWDLKNMAFDGFAAISDPLRADAFEAVRQCRAAGIDLKILTGDNIVTATAIANELGVLDNNRRAEEARRVLEMSDQELADLLPRVGVIARSTPALKMRVVKLLQKMGQVVAVTGDGINDAPALKHADVGIAMGVSGTEVSKEAGDIVLLDDSLSTLVNAVRWGRGIYENFKRFIVFQLTANAASVAVVLGSVILLREKVPFTALQLLWVNIIMDGPPALTLGLEPIHDDLMARPPVRRDENILARSMLARIGATALYITAVMLLQYRFNFLGASEETWCASDGDWVGERMTVLFALFALFLLFNAFNCRELRGASIFKTFWANGKFLAVISVTFVLQILVIQYGGGFFDTVPLPPVMWGKLLLTASSVVAVSELVKKSFRLKIKLQSVSLYKL